MENKIENKIEKEFVTYDIALKLKELGFNKDCIGYFIFNDMEKNRYISTKMYNRKPNELQAPLWQQAIDFFREKYNFHIHVTKTDKVWCNIINKHIEDNPQLERKINDYIYSFNIIDNNDDAYFGYYPSYQEARESAILKAIELIKNK